MMVFKKGGASRCEERGAQGAQGRLRDCKHLRPGRDACSAGGGLGFKTGSCGAHLCLELGTIGLDGMKDNSHFASDDNFGFLGSDPFGQLAAPALQRGSPPDYGQEDIRRLEQIRSGLMVAALGNAAGTINLAGLVTSWCQAEIGRRRRRWNA